MDRDCTLINTGGPSVATLAVAVFCLLLILRGLVVPGVNTIIRGISGFFLLSSSVLDNDDSSLAFLKRHLLIT